MPEPLGERLTHSDGETVRCTRHTSGNARAAHLKKLEQVFVTHGLCLAMVLASCFGWALVAWSSRAAGPPAMEEEVAGADSSTQSPASSQAPKAKAKGSQKNRGDRQGEYKRAAMVRLLRRHPESGLATHWDTLTLEKDKKECCRHACNLLPLARHGSHVLYCINIGCSTSFASRQVRSTICRTWFQVR